MVVLTTSDAEQDILRSYDLHANCYITKPVDLDQFITVVQVDRGLLADDRDAAARAMNHADAADPRVLLIEDNPGDARLIREMLASRRAPAARVRARARRPPGGWAGAAGAAGDVDVVLLDLSLPDSHGLETFRASARRRRPTCRSSC